MKLVEHATEKTGENGGGGGCGGGGGVGGSGGPHGRRNNPELVCFGLQRTSASAFQCHCVFASFPVFERVSLQSGHLADPPLLRESFIAVAAAAA